nr:hypothetical protein [Tanacetum cinerariifolium]
LAERDADRSRNDEDSYDSEIGVRRQAPPAHECTYQDFMKCNPFYFKGTEGWVERMETVFRISNCTMENQIKFATCTLLESALTWWNSHVMTIGLDVAYAMTWTNLRKKMIDKYCPRGKIKKLEESDKVERYVSGLPDVIHGSVVASRPKTIQEAIEMETELMDKRNNTLSKCQAENKQKFDDTSKNNQNQQQLHNKRQNTGTAYTAGSCDKKPYGGSKPLCPKCNYHHDGHAGTNPYSNIVTGTFLLNNRYASILFDTGADRIFVSTAFSSQIDITPTALDYYYDVELSDGRIIGLNTILRGCTLNFLYHLFNIEYMLVELGSFDAIIGMDWLAKYQAVIVCAEKIIRIPWGMKP